MDTDSEDGDRGGIKVHHISLRGADNSRLVHDAKNCHIAVTELKEQLRWT